MSSSSRYQIKSPSTSASDERNSTIDGDASELGTLDRDVGSRPPQMTSGCSTSATEFPSAPLPFSTVSSTPPTGKNGTSRSQKPPPVMNTIESSGGDGYGSDGRPMQQPPTHAMFNLLYEDSDGSDGSIVFNNKKKQPQGRDRFPSFDSMASSGSVVRHAPQQRSNLPSPQGAPAQVNPQMLPYDQRRKLTKLKQQQQKKQPPPPQHQPQQTRRPDGRYMQYMMPPPEVNQPPPPYHYNQGLPIPPTHSPQHFAYPMQQHPIPMQIPIGAYPVPHNVRLSPYRSQQQPPRYDPNRPIPPGMKQSGRGRPCPTVQPQPPLWHTLPPRNDAPSPKDKLSQSNSLDSSDQAAPGQARGGRNSTPSNQSEPSNGATSINNSSSTPPPPPPPPPPVPPNHVRAESNGSVSSLGSQGSIFGYFANQDDESRRKQSGGRNEFLRMLNPFSPKKRQPSPQEFHRKNQKFLKKQSTAGRKARQPPPAQQHRRVGSMDRPPASRGTHKRLPSIENDDWGEPGSDLMGLERSDSERSSEGNASPSSQLSSSGEEATEVRAHAKRATNEEANERTSLLPPSGQGSSEQFENARRYRRNDIQIGNRRRSKQKSSRRRFRENDATFENNNVPSPYEHSRGSSQRKAKKKSRRRSRRIVKQEEGSSGSEQSSSSSSYDYRQWTRRRAQMLEDERSRLIAQWKAEARAEAVASRRRREDEQWHRRLGRHLDSEFGDLLGRAYKVLTFLEVFICNLPLTVGAIAMSIVTLGVVWFKFMEETLDSCEPTQFHSAQCVYPEFPGCFFCNTTDPYYQIAVNFHFACSALAGIFALSFVLKMLLATQVVLDEMSSPTTASPAGLVCMTTVCVFAGRGLIGQILVSIAACIHLGLVIWFIYMALAYHIMPEPSWFPNTVGIGMSAVKVWLYYPMSGHFLMAISLSLNFFFFPISLIRVALNEKISSTVCWMQMSAPAISLYALTIMAQPSFEQEKPDINRFQRAHRLVYLPAMHFLFVMSCIGFLASVQSLVVRWKEFRKREFSPAHAAFCFPTLSHANAIQAYRAAINSFSSEPPGTPFKIALDTYWVIMLVCGTVVTLWVTAKFFYNLPSWTNIDVEDEDEPPAPYETTITVQNVIALGESLVQPFVSPAVLQANETGALVLVRRNQDDSRQRFVRTRKLAALGFEPTMNWSEMERERDLLLEWVGKHPPRRRTRTLSVPGIDFNYGPDFGVGGVYGDGSDLPLHGARARAHTNSPYRNGGAFF